MFNCLKKLMKKTNSRNENLLEISNKFCSNDVVCKQMLELLNNKTTTIKLDEDIKNSYYVFLNDTIYLSDKEKNKTNYQRLCVVAHECIHSIQNKIMQFINFIFSNIELIGFVLALIFIICKFNFNIVFYSYLILNILSIVPRLILEIDAIMRSIILSRKYMKEVIDENQSNILIKSYKIQMLLLFPIFIMSLLFGRVLRVYILYLLK